MNGNQEMILVFTHKIQDSVSFVWRILLKFNNVLLWKRGRFVETILETDTKHSLDIVNNESNVTCYFQALGKLW